jgi:hypothetical protein
VTVRQPEQLLELELTSELPTQPDLERSALAAKLAVVAARRQRTAERAKAAAAARTAASSLEAAPPPPTEWCDSEAPTGVEVERPLFPPPPRNPKL